MPILTTNRLVLEPVRTEHAAEMLSVVSSPDLYVFLPDDPPTLAELTERYRRWEKRRSPSGDEAWLNWIGRLKTTGAPVGQFQAGLKLDHSAYIAYLVAPSYQRQGLALEAMGEICAWLEQERKATLIRAVIDTRNLASCRLAEKLQMTRVEYRRAVERFKGHRSEEFVYERASKITS